MVEGDSLREKSVLELSDTKRKTLGLGPTADEISLLREHWAELANAALEKAGQSARIDHRSLVDQQVAAAERGDLAESLALQREPQRHVGVHATQLDRRSKQAVSERGKLRERVVAAARYARSAAAKWANELMTLMRSEAEKLVMAEVAAEQATDPSQADAMAQPADPLASLLQKWRKPAPSVPLQPQDPGRQAGRLGRDNIRTSRPARDPDQERGYES